MYDLYNKLLFIYCMLAFALYLALWKNIKEGGIKRIYTYIPQTQTTLDVLAF